MLLTLIEFLEVKITFGEPISYTIVKLSRGTIKKYKDFSKPEGTLL